ncbi:hypothetical protein BSTEL_1876 [Bifidobacterium stellenboschense]|uniref:Uncharacterized protein n=1 Tax=Bifidobacterium stellenboschense TaxID=762211 RepID=A0A087DN67_9BIFI|nr:hypothetical protein BSTEL_1876 [Bifidobacterium stellenboschense]
MAYRRRVRPIPAVFVDVATSTRFTPGAPPVGQRNRGAVVPDHTAAAFLSSSRWWEVARSAGGWSRVGVRCVRRHGTGCSRVGRLFRMWPVHFGYGPAVSVNGAGRFRGVCGGCARRVAPEPASHPVLLHNTRRRACCGAAFRRNSRGNPCSQRSGPVWCATTHRNPGSRPCCGAGPLHNSRRYRSHRMLWSSRALKSRHNSHEPPSTAVLWSATVPQHDPRMPLWSTVTPTTAPRHEFRTSCSGASPRPAARIDTASGARKRPLAREHPPARERPGPRTPPVQERPRSKNATWPENVPARERPARRLPTASPQAFATGVTNPGEQPHRPGFLTLGASQRHKSRTKPLISVIRDVGSGSASRVTDDAARFPNWGRWEGLSVPGYGRSRSSPESGTLGEGSASRITDEAAHFPNLGHWERLSVPGYG